MYLDKVQRRVADLWQYIIRLTSERRAWRAPSDRAEPAERPSEGCRARRAKLWSDGAEGAEQGTDTGQGSKTECCERVKRASSARTEALARGRSKRRAERLYTTE